METRSFADYLRTLDDAALISLFSHRPDLITPVPPDVASLAVRASSAPSLARAIDALNAWQYQVLEACAIAAEPFTEKTIAALTDKAALFVIPGLLERGLIYQGKDGFYLPTTVREVLGNEIQGLGPQTVVKLNLKKLDEAPPAAQKALEAMVWGPPRGTVADVKKPGAGVAWLLENNFVVAANTKTVLLVREVALALRGGKLHKELQVQEPTLKTEKRDLKSVQLAAIANITTFLRWTEEILNFWAQEPADALRSGGLGVRDLKVLSAHLGVDTSCAAFIAEVSYLAGLVTIDADDRILPTTQFDIWLMQTPSSRWQSLVSPWLITSRVSGLVGKDESKNVAPLGPELDRVSAAPIRKLVLRLLSDNPSVAPEFNSFAALATWHMPAKRSNGIPTDYLQWALRESEWLGITGQGVISKYGIEFLAGGELESINEDLPKPVDHILIQSDHTAIAPRTAGT
jgi:hypothetical protein